MTAELVTSFPGRGIPATAGDTAFEKFYARYNPPLVGWAGKAFGAADAEDIAQETMARALTHFHELDPGRDPWPWLCVVARRVGTDIVRSRSRTIVVEDHRLADVPADDGATPADQALANDDRRALRKALARLSANDRRVLRLREFDDLSSSDMAALLDCSETAVRQQLFRARRRLAEHFRALTTLSILSPAAFVRPTFRRAGRWFGKAGGTGTVTTSGLAMSTMVIVGSGAALTLGGVSAPRAVDLERTTLPSVQVVQLGSQADRPAGSTLVALRQHTAPAPATRRAPVFEATTDAAAVTVRNEKPADPTRSGTSGRYYIGVEVLGNRTGVHYSSTDPNNYSALCALKGVECQSPEEPKR